MIETDWTRVVDACDILEVSKVLIHFAARANKEDRTRIESNNTSLTKMSLPSGVHFPCLRNFKQLGRRNGIAESMCCTRMHSPMASKRSENTTLVSMISQALSWHSVRL
jgi:hypothetical protein